MVLPRIDPPHQHPNLKALFTREWEPHFLSSDPKGAGLSWKRYGGDNQLDGWIYGRLDGRML